MNKFPPSDDPCSSYWITWKQAVQNEIKMPRTCSYWKEEALNVYLSGRAALEDGGFGDNFEMFPTCNTNFVRLSSTKRAASEFVVTCRPGFAGISNHMT